MGAGFMWLRRELVTALDPPYFYWLGAKRSMDFEDLTEYDHLRFDDARRYEGGTYHHGDIYAFAGSLGMLLAIGALEIEAKAQALAQQVPTPKPGSVASPSTCPPAPNPALSSAWRRPVPPRSSSCWKPSTSPPACAPGCIRVSPYFYNTPQEISHLFAVIDKLI